MLLLTENPATRSLSKMSNDLLSVSGWETEHRNQGPLLKINSDLTSST